jgi:teichuronic acid biosynthesis glycosyltransferase TuaG
MKMGENFSCSVVIPVYNGESFILQAIESCLNQSLAPDEIIVVDDASTDSTAQLIENAGYPTLHYLRNESRQGPAYSRNLGIKTARSKWIFFLDADDRFHPEKITILSRYLLSHPAVKALAHNFTIGNSFSAVPETLPIPVTVTPFQVLFRNPAVTPALCVRVDNNIFFDENLHYAEDHDFILRTAEENSLTYWDLPLCSLGRKPLSIGGLSSARWKMRKGEIYMYRKFCWRRRIIFLFPFFFIFSLLKHLRQCLIPSRIQ